MKKKLIGVAIAITIVALAVAFVVLRPRGSGLPRVTLPDGKQVTIQAVTYGTNHVFVHGSETLDKIQRYLPFTSRWLPPLMALRMPTREEFLVLHYSVCDPVTAKYSYLPVDTLSVIDEHGCTLVRNHVVGLYRGTPRFSVSSTTVRVFPRRQKTFTVRMKFAGYAPVDFPINNPLPPSTNQWTPEPLPATRQTNNLAVTLTKIILQKGSNYAAPFQDIYENGTNRNAWYSVSRTFRDATGNASGTFLCLHERAWKVELDLHRHADTPFPESRIWRIPNVTLPESGTVLPLTNYHYKVGNWSWLPIAFCGPGDYIFSNDVCVFSAPWNQRSHPIVPTFVNPGEFKFACKNPLVLVRVDGSRAIDRYFIRATDRLLIRAQTREDGLKQFRFSSGEGKLETFEMDQPVPGGQTIALEFIPQEPIHVEFLVEPPRP